MAFYIGAMGALHRPDPKIVDQWTGTIAWSPEMPHVGPQHWPTLPGSGGSPLPDRYQYSTCNGSHATACMFNDRGRERYMGSAQRFASIFHTHNPSSEGVAPVHAQAAATMLMLQLALELAPAGRGWGMEYDQLFNATLMGESMAALGMNGAGARGISTFWGNLSMVRTAGSQEGFNSAFQFGIAQFQGGKLVLVGPGDYAQTGVVYPAQWACEIRGNCPKPGLHRQGAAPWLDNGAHFCCCGGLDAASRSHPVEMHNTDQ